MGVIEHVEFNKVYIQYIRGFSWAIQSHSLGVKKQSHPHQNTFSSAFVCTVMDELHRLASPYRSAELIPNTHHCHFPCVQLEAIADH